jgi:hypothetical protein
MKEKGYGYATMKVDACISMGFFGNKDLGRNHIPKYLVNNIKRKGFNKLLKFCDYC